MLTLPVYDWPTRIFHWLFAAFFVTAFAISNLLDDDSAGFPLHMLAGMALCGVVLLRLVWSLAGTRHARLSDLKLGPAQLMSYLKGTFGGTSQRWVGHNPASSWAAVVMVGLGIGLGTTGYLMASGSGSEILEDAHELMANAFLAVVLLHIAGLIVHALRHHDRLAASMVTGRKQALSSDRQAVRSHPFVGLAFVALTGLSVVYLLKHYDAQTRSLDLFGQVLQLGEDETSHSSGAKDRDRHEGANEHE
ncbi:cytochrome b/b6 domain-containing protein [Pseudoxanthomonas wuyuanensis]|uniref:Cytochrome b n=1 Tax=Pseudoxanthomonas wuyuanensis TaxID=1073196 RepID=A0A286CYK0_9GAMM|nr:cytochrome b/b6 domain-containing protein [Pseudoxanthomonas wuyuanensis]SOD51478.1 Cytochrome b [Pseudoxanthomonas wuyuanensis]